MNRTERIEATAEAAKPVAIGLMERGLHSTDAIRMGTLWAVFMQKNEGVVRDLIEEGHDRAFVERATMDAFETFCRNASK